MGGKESKGITGAGTGMEGRVREEAGVWEKEREQEWEANKRDLNKIKKDFGDQVQQVHQGQQHHQQLADGLVQENQRLLERVAQLASYNEELEERVKKPRVPSVTRPERVASWTGVGLGTPRTQTQHPQGSLHGSTVRSKKRIPSPVIDACPLEENPPKKFQFTASGGATQHRNQTA